MSDLPQIATVAHVIQLAVAPVFLFSGVAAMLSVLVGRLGRVVDRFRELHDQKSEASELALVSIKNEMGTLSKRARAIHWAIGLCITCALLVCVVIVTLFIGAVAKVDVSTLVSVQFIFAMLALIVGLLLFLSEIKMARSSIHVVPH